MASAMLKQRVRRPSYLDKLCKAEDLLHLFPNGAYIGWSGFTGVGYPKYAHRNALRFRSRSIERSEYALIDVNQ
jgi:acyl-CoA hydrolase